MAQHDGMQRSQRDSYVFSSESVSEGHPDKLADRISDAVLDLYLSRDPKSRVACETLVTKNFVCIAGEVRSRAGARRATSPGCAPTPSRRSPSATSTTDRTR